MSKPSELVVVANRLPVHQVESGGETRWETSPGGLVSALNSVIRDRGVTWIGWTGVEGDPPAPFEHGGIRHVPVGLTPAEVEDFYRNFSNRTLWPLYHDAVRPPEYHRHWWRPYVAVNRRFAQAVADALPPGGTAWIHDYHLQLVPGMLRELRPDAKISFFLHIPFPPMELFAQIPWRKQILEGILGADLIGMQTETGAHNFFNLAERFAGAKPDGESLEYRGRKVAVRALPISIDVDKFETMAEAPEVQDEVDQLKEKLGGKRRVLLGVDRLDYTKGIDIRLRAFDTLLQNNPNMANEVAFIQIAVPSREWVQEYGDIRQRIEQLVGQINGAHGEPGRVPVHYLYRNFSTEKLVPYFRAADVMVVTPLRDGMNLVAKEYVASRVDERGVLVLSEFAGAAWELEQALQVNPHDIDGLAFAFYRALEMTESEVRDRMQALRRSVRESDVFRWARECLPTLDTIPTPDTTPTAQE